MPPLCQIICEARVTYWDENSFILVEPLLNEQRRFFLARSCHKSTPVIIVKLLNLEIREIKLEKGTKIGTYCYLPSQTPCTEAHIRVTTTTPKNSEEEIKEL